MHRLRRNEMYGQILTGHGFLTGHLPVKMACQETMRHACNEIMRSISYGFFSHGLAHACTRQTGDEDLYSPESHAEE